MAELEEAEREYEEAQLSAALNLQTLELRLPGLEKELAQAKQNYETQLLQAKLTLEESLAKAESAESNYETAVKQAESDYETLKDAWEDAKENLELFERTAGDGYFYASGSGTVLRTMVRAGQELMAESIIFMYSDPAAMTVTVSVDQADIAGIALGDRVYIQSSESGGFEGLVTEIDPVSSSTSRTSVTYRVTVEFTEDASVLGANESVTVIFGGDVDALKAMQNPAEGAQMPEGGQMPEEGQIPAGSRMSGGSQEPEGNRMPEGSQKPEGSRMSEGSQVPEGGQMPE